MHELTHVWQYQNGGIAYIGDSTWAYLTQQDNVDGAYNYEKAIEQGLAWEDWSPEQQARAVEDYWPAKQRLDKPRPEHVSEELDRAARERARATVERLEPYMRELRAGRGSAEFSPFGGVVGAGLGAGLGAALGGVVGGESGATIGTGLGGIVGGIIGAG